jgi:hypothetical protein
MLDELLGSRTAAAAEPSPEGAEELPAPAALPEPEAGTASGTYDDSATMGEARALPVAPMIIAGTGALLVGAGIVFGVMANGTEDDYSKQAVTSMAEARAASSLRDRGRRQALIANVLFGAGATAAAVGGVWLLLSIGKVGDPPQTAVIPDFGPEHAALSVSGRWSGL